MLDDVKKVKARLEKEIKQSHTACGKCKTTVSFASDLIQEREETKADDRSSDSFQSELEQLTLSDVNDDELNDLDLSEIKQGKGGIVVDQTLSTLDECLNMSLLCHNVATIQTTPNNTAK